MIIETMRIGSQPWIAPLMAVCLAVSLICLPGLGFGSAQAGPGPLEVVVSIPPWADLVERVGGEHVEVHTLLPAGTSPHSFEPLPSQALLLGSSDLIVSNGGLDGWLDRLVEATAPNSVRLVIMDRIVFDAIQGHGAEGHDEDSANPHIWLDPSIAAEGVTAIAGSLSSIRPELAQTFEESAASLRADLQALDAEIATQLRPVGSRPFVQFHDAWSYFARRYGLDLVATLEPFPGREPSVRYVAETVRSVTDAGAVVIFDGRQLAGRTAQVVAESAGLRVVTLDPLGGHPGPVGYDALLRFNAGLVAAALAGTGP